MPTCHRGCTRLHCKVDMVNVDNQSVLRVLLAKKKVTLYKVLHTLYKTKNNFPYIFQLLAPLQRYAGGVVVAGSNPAVPTIN